MSDSKKIFGFVSQEAKVKTVTTLKSFRMMDGKYYRYQGERVVTSDGVAEDYFPLVNERKLFREL